MLSKQIIATLSDKALRDLLAEIKEYEKVGTLPDGRILELARDDARLSGIPVNYALSGVSICIYREAAFRWESENKRDES